MSRFLLPLLASTTLVACVEPEPTVGTEHGELAVPPHWRDPVDLPDLPPPDDGGGWGGEWGGYNVTVDECYQEYKVEERDCIDQFLNDSVSRNECLDTADSTYRACVRWAERPPVPEDSPNT